MCMNNGSELVSIETPEEYSFLKEKILAMETKEYYIGLRNYSGVWRWISNDSTVSASKENFHWATGEPNGYKHNCICQCAKMYYDTVNTKPVYDDIKCTAKASNIGYICEKPVESTRTKSMSQENNIHF